MVRSMTDLAEKFRRLNQSNVHVATAEAIVARLRERIEAGRLRGRDTQAEQQQLHMFEASLAVFRHRVLILDAIRSARRPIGRH